MFQSFYYNGEVTYMKFMIIINKTEYIFVKKIMQEVKINYYILFSESNTEK